MRRGVLGAVILITTAGASWRVPQPSAIQRATGVIHARNALEPLDSVLRIRVLDRRGATVPGVSVQWTLENPGEGATLTVMNAITDALGLSAVAFTPGRSANPQSAVAEVQDVGRIPFTVTVPAVHIRVLPTHVSLWAGDDTVLAAELRDRAGVVLAGGAVSWASLDTAIARVVSDSSPHAPVHGRLAGSTQIVAWVGDGKVRGTGRVSVRPVITGRFITADSGRVPDVVVEVSSAGRRDSIEVGEGRFTTRFAFPPGEAVTLHASSADPAYHDVALRVDDERELQRLVIALVPAAFRIAAGSHVGQVIPIDAASAMERVGRSAPFWRLVPYSGTGPRKLLGWREDDLPLRVAFDREHSVAPITAEDSSAFWQIAQRMERDLGRGLFVPADSRTDTTHTLVIRVRVTPQDAEGHTFVSWTQAGDANDGLLRFSRASTLRDPHVVTHELTHLLGFGHSASWPTVSQPSTGDRPRLTPQDVGYMQLAMQLRRLHETEGARPGLPVLQR